jgi:hypothetical protein
VKKSDATFFWPPNSFFWHGTSFHPWVKQIAVCLQEHHGPDDVPERWKCVREGTSPSLHIQPGLPPDTNDMDLTWKSTLRAAKKLFDSLHTSTATAAGAVEGMLALASSPPLSDSGGVPSISEAGQGTPAAGGVDEPHSHLPMLVSNPSAPLIYNGFWAGHHISISSGRCSWTKVVEYHLMCRRT